MILDMIRSDMLNARKNKETDNATFLSMVYSEAKNIGKNNGNRDTTDDEVVTMLQKLKKSDEETLDIARKNNRAENINKLENELVLINKYLPKMLSKQELTEIITKQITSLEVKDKKSMGIIMKYLKTNYNGTYDGKQASTIIKNLL